VRGGIAIGALVKSWGLVSGSALVKAYEMEKQAKHPRVLIDVDLVDVVRQLSTQGNHDLAIAQLVARDRHCSYVDYLRYGSRLTDWDEQAEFFRSHKQIVEEGLARFSSSPHIREKYQWLRRYHNSRVPMIPLPAFENLKI